MSCVLVRILNLGLTGSGSIVSAFLIRASSFLLTAESAPLFYGNCLYGAHLFEWWPLILILHSKFLTMKTGAVEPCPVWVHLGNEEKMTPENGWTSCNTEPRSKCSSDWAHSGRKYSRILLPAKLYITRLCDRVWILEWIPSHLWTVFFFSLRSPLACVNYKDFSLPMGFAWTFQGIASHEVFFSYTILTKWIKMKEWIILNLKCHPSNNKFFPVTNENPAWSLTIFL
jgi:hypothetical protein